MSILIAILLAVLPKIIEWLLSLIRSNKQLSGRQLERMNHITWYAAQLAETSPKVGCAAGGMQPPAAAVLEDDDLFELEATAVGGPILEGWLTKLIIDLLRKHGKEFGLRIAKTVVLPWLKEQAAKTTNKLDDYGARQLERILNDPELIAILEGVG